MPLKPAARPSIDFAAIAVGLAALLTFAPSLRGGFVWDDLDYVKNNPILHAAGGAMLAKLATLVVVGNYHPLTMASLVLDNALFGPGPLMFHATNVLLHAANAVLVGRLLLALGIRSDAAWAGAFLWAVHPLRVESVAWISGRKDVLHAVFFLAALLAYLRHVRSDVKPGRPYVWALALFTGSLLAKAAAVSFVPVLFLVDWYAGRPVTRRSLVEKIPFAALAVAIGGIAIAAQKSAGAIPMDPGGGLGPRLAIAGYGLGFYLVKTVAPWGLSALYPYPTGPPGALPAGSLVAFAAASGAAVAVIAGRVRFRAGVLAAGFYVATVALVLQLFPVGGAVAADRYSYLPAVGFSIAIAAGLGALRFRQAGLLATVSVGLLLMWGSAARCAVWHDGFALWDDVVAKHPGAALALHNRGVARADRGDPRGAIADYDAAIAASPGYADAWANRGGSEADLGELDRAIADLGEAIRLDAERATYRFNLGLALGDTGRWDEALQALSEAIRLNPDFAAAYLNRGLALEQMGRTGEGSADVRRAKALGYPVPAAVLGRFP